MNISQPTSKEPIAIVGLGCRLPGDVKHPDDFHRILFDGIDAITEIPSDRWDTSRYRDVIPNHGGFIKGVDLFDAEFFQISPREAAALDPQQRVLLEVSWEALEHAGINPEGLRESPTGVFVGIFSNDYQTMQTRQTDDPSLYLSTGTSSATASGRLSYFFGFQGPAISIDTASSSSLVAFHLAVQSLQSKDCQLALAAGVNLILAPDLNIAFAKAGMLSPDGRSRGFDSAANGYVRGEGCVVVVLKRLSDAQRENDNILAVVRGTAINQDGASQGLTAPSGTSQEAVIRKALEVAQLQPSDISYVEAHGSGTPLGDPIEGHALQAAYCSNGRTDPLVVGSVKTNIGHLEAAAGVAGVMKTVLALQQRRIPRHLHFKQLNPRLTNFQGQIPTREMSWEPNGTGIRRAGVSSFGFSGTNAHVILEEGPQKKKQQSTSDRLPQVLAISAKNEQALRELAQRYTGYLDAHPDVGLANLCHSANTGRAHFTHRLALLADSTDDLQEQLHEFTAGDSLVGLSTGAANQSPKIAFLFTGQGSQYVGMGRELYESQPTFRRTLDQCDAILRPLLQQSILQVMFPLENESSAIDDTAYTQPTLFALEYALAKLWQSWGIEPDVVMGHSVGEYVAACIAGVFSLEDGLRLIAERGRLIQALPQDGDMVAVRADFAHVECAIAPFAASVSVAAFNGPESLVVSGERQALHEALSALPQLKSKRLSVSHAFHSPLMEPMLATFAETAHQVRFSPPTCKFVSNVSGKIVHDEVATPDYWIGHVRQPVNFAGGMATLQRERVDAYLEIGPNATLLGMGRACAKSPQTANWLPSLRPERADWQQMSESLATLYAQGAAVNWRSFSDGHDYNRLVLPSYPFQRQRHWMEETPRTLQATNGRNGNASHSQNRLRMSIANDPSIRIAFDFAQENPSYLAHHRIFGKAVLPAGMYLEIGISSGKEVLNTHELRLENVTLEQTLVFANSSDSAHTLQAVLKPPLANEPPADDESAQEDATIFQLFSVAKTDTGSWVRHATGQLKCGVVLSNEPIDLGTLRRRCPESRSVEAFYSQAAKRQVEYRHASVDAGGDPTFQTLEELWSGHDDQALGRVQLHPSLSAEAELYVLHNTLIEGAIQVAMSAFPLELESKTYLPVGVERLSVMRGGATELWAYAKLCSAGADPDILRADVLMLDDSGVIAEITGLSFKATTPETLFRTARSGQQELRPPERVSVLEQLKGSNPAQHQVFIEQYVQSQVREVLGLRKSQPLPAERPLKELGFDSLMSTDLKSRLESDLKVMLPIERILQDSVSAQRLSKILLDKVGCDELNVETRCPPEPLSVSEDQKGPVDFHGAALDIPQIHAVVTEQIARKVRVDGRWVYDFASCNYLGLDLRQEVMDAIPAALEKWGVHPSWTRAVASPEIYEELEQELADLVGAPSTLVFPAVTLLHSGVLSVLLGYDGVVFKDLCAHQSIYEACRLAQTNGAEMVDFKHNDPADLEEKLARYPLDRTKIIAIDGVYSMSGAYPRLPEFARLAKQYNAWVYMDDAHGVGVIGENPTPEMPYGFKGNGIVRHYGLDYAEDRLIYVAGLSKSFSSFGAFITCTDEEMKNRFRSASTFIFSGPSPVASLASAIAGLKLNRAEGDQWRSQVYTLTHRLVTGAKELGYEVVNENYFPIVGVVIGTTSDVIMACKVLWEYGILITPALYPLVAMDRGLLRFSITAANTEEEIERSIQALTDVKARLTK